MFILSYVWITASNELRAVGEVSKCLLRWLIHVEYPVPLQKLALDALFVGCVYGEMQRAWLRNRQHIRAMALVSATHTTRAEAVTSWLVLFPRCNAHRNHGKVRGAANNRNGSRRASLQNDRLSTHPFYQIRS